MMKKIFLVVFISFFIAPAIPAQVWYNTSGAYGLRKLVTTYTGSAVQVRRSCDNATRDIGFTSCGDLDTTTLKNFLVIANPLGNISTATAASYGLRKLSCSYSGKAIQVRRSSDNTTQDIGFTSDSDLDTAALKTFVGNNSAFVTTWYDQSGNGRNATQATTGKQPRIVNAGVIDRLNGKPAIRYLGQGYSLFTAGYSAYSSAYTMNFVAKVNTDMSYNGVVNKCNSNFPKPFDFYNATQLTGNASTYLTSGLSQTFNAAKGASIWSFTGASGGTMIGYCNGSSVGSTAVSAANYGDGAGDGLYIGHRVDGFVGLGIDGWVCEVTTFGAVLSTNDRQFLEWDQSQYYSLTGPAITSSAPHGYISKWYDQSGNVDDLAQTTLASQPRIVVTGVISRQGVKPSVLFNGTSSHLTHNSFPTTGYTGFTANIIAKWTTTGTTTATIQVLLDNNHSVGNGFIMQDRPDQTNKPLSFSAPTVSIGAVDNATTGNGTSRIITCTNNGTSDVLNRNGSVISTVANAGAYAFQSRFVMGAWWNGGTQQRFLSGVVPEASLFQSALGKTRRTLIETNQAAYHNISITNSKYTPPSSTTYTLYVNGVGRESITDSIAATRESVGMGFCMPAGPNFLQSDGDYMCSGIDCAITPYISTANLPGTVVQRWINDWYITKTDVGTTGGNISIYFDFSEYGVTGTPGIASNYVLLTRSSAGGTFSIVAGTSVTVSGDRVTFTVDAANISNNWYTIGTKNPGQSTLPVELLSFDAKACGENVCTTWSTAFETNNDYFTVERSADGQNFEAIGIVQGAGTSSSQHDYSFTDHAPYHGTSYYRLKQTDYNTDHSYSVVVPVKFGAYPQAVIYPNPNNGSMQINYSIESRDKGEIELYDLSGKPLHLFLLPADQKSISIDKLQLEDGVYYYKYTVNGKTVGYDKIAIIN